MDGVETWVLVENPNPFPSPWTSPSSPLKEW